MSEDLETRITSLEHWKAKIDIRDAGTSLAQQYMDKRFDSLDRRLDRYDAHISKFIWAIILASLAAIMAFILRGGLLLAPQVIQ